MPNEGGKLGVFGNAEKPYRETEDSKEHGQHLQTWWDDSEEAPQYHWQGHGPKRLERHPES